MHPVESNLATSIKIMYTDALWPNNSTLWNLSRSELHTLGVMMYKIVQYSTVQRQARQPETGNEPDAFLGDGCGTSIQTVEYYTTGEKNKALKVFMLKILEMHAEWKKPAAKRWTLHAIFCVKVREIQNYVCNKFIWRKSE